MTCYPAGNLVPATQQYSLLSIQSLVICPYSTHLFICLFQISNLVELSADKLLHWETATNTQIVCLQKRGHQNVQPGGLIIFQMSKPNMPISFLRLLQYLHMVISFKPLILQPDIQYVKRFWPFRMQICSGFQKWFIMWRLLYQSRENSRGKQMNIWQASLILSFPQGLFCYLCSSTFTPSLC